MPQPTSAESSNLDARTTQTIEMKAKKEARRPKIFFIRRVPFRHVDRVWKRPPDDVYRKNLMNEGFVTADLLEGPMSAELQADIRELDQHLLPHFWRVNQEAKYYQNRYYQYQWVFILAAFFTTAFAAVNVLVYAQGLQDGVDTGTFIGTIKWTEILGFLTAAISGTAATVSFLDANQTPQGRWFKARAQAESLRSLYFLFLARQNPFNLPDARTRVQELRRKVIDVLVDSPGAEQIPRMTGSTGQFRAAPKPNSDTTTRDTRND